MMAHPYFKTFKAEQHEAAKDHYKTEALRFLTSMKPPVTGRVLEVNTGSNRG